MAGTHRWNIAMAALMVGMSFGLGRWSANPSEPEAVRAQKPHPEKVQGKIEATRTQQAFARKEKKAEWPPERRSQKATAAATLRSVAPELEKPTHPEGQVPDPRHAPQGKAGLPSCEDTLEELQAQLVEQEKRRQAKEGKAIEAKNDVAPRFSQRGLVDTFTRAFDLTDIEGRVESVDCIEYPCILFGRLQGDEGAVATLEDSAPFAAYDNDIGVMLTWASGDHAHGEARHAGVDRQKPAEISLFSFAFYSESDREEYGELIDRRIRVRTAEYWNASSPHE